MSPRFIGFLVSWLLLRYLRQKLPPVGRNSCLCLNGSHSSCANLPVKPVAGIVLQPWVSGKLFQYLGVRERICAGLSGFFDDLPGIFIVPERDKLRVTQVIGSGPLQELDVCDQVRADPDTFLHFLRGEPLPPSAGGRLGKRGYIPKN